MNRIILSFFIWIFGYISIGIVCQAQMEYGPYKTELVSIEQCKGPKKGECTILNLYIAPDKSSVRFTSDIQKECLIKNAKVIVKKANHTGAMWKHQTNQPCQHFFLGPILKKTFDLTGSNNCYTHKGHYETNMDVQETPKKFLGPTFFYDTFNFKLLVHNDANNLYCIESVFRTIKL